MTLQDQIDILIDRLEKEENKNKELQCELIAAKATIKHQEDLIQKMKLPQETIEHCFNTINTYLKQEMNAHLPARTSTDMLYVRDVSAFIHTLQNTRRTLLNETLDK